jgi:peroxiredoxin Q/BCP
MQMKLTVGKPAPLFELPDQDGKIHRLKDSLGTWVLLYFYPKDNTPGCTKEACTIAEAFPDFAKLKIQVFGMSADSVASHKKFAEKYKLPFPLLSDESKKTIKAYGAWGTKKFMGREYEGIFRMSFLIDPKGNIAHIYEKVTPVKHADEVLAFFAEQS